MDELIENVIGYHVNEKLKCKKSLKDVKELWSKDKTWLGDGIYFWDNVSNANYWVGKKLKEHKSVIILKTHIFLNEVLDLTSEETNDYINKLWLEFSKRSALIKEGKSYELGEKLNFLINMVELDAKVIKAVGVYYRDYRSIFDGVVKNLTQHCKTVYCVRDISKIHKLEILEESGRPR